MISMKPPVRQNHRFPIFPEKKVEAGIANAYIAYYGGRAKEQAAT
jgi:hypothetical protein